MSSTTYRDSSSAPAGQNAAGGFGSNHGCLGSLSVRYGSRNPDAPLPLLPASFSDPVVAKRRAAKMEPLLEKHGLSRDTETGVISMDDSEDGVNATSGGSPRKMKNGTMLVEKKEPSKCAQHWNRFLGALAEASKMWLAVAILIFGFVGVFIEIDIDEE